MVSKNVISFYEITEILPFSRNVFNNIDFLPAEILKNSFRKIYVYFLNEQSGYRSSKATKSFRAFNQD